MTVAVLLKKEELCSSITLIISHPTDIFQLLADAKL